MVQIPLIFLHFIKIINDHELPKPYTKQEILNFFKPFDIYKDGKIKAIHLIEMLKNKGEPLSQQDIDQLLLEIDIDGDHYINIEQFVNHMFETSYDL